MKNKLRKRNVLVLTPQEVCLHFVQIVKGNATMKIEFN